MPIFRASKSLALKLINSAMYACAHTTINTIYSVFADPGGSGMHTEAVVRTQIHRSARIINICIDMLAMS